MTKLPYTTEQIEAAARKVELLEIELQVARDLHQNMKIENGKVERQNKKVEAQKYSPAKHAILTALSTGSHIYQKRGGTHELVTPRNETQRHSMPEFETVREKTFDALITGGLIQHSYNKEMRSSWYLISAEGQEILKQWDTKQANKVARKSLEWKSE